MSWFWKNHDKDFAVDLALWKADPRLASELGIAFVAKQVRYSYSSDGSDCVLETHYERLSNE